MPNSLTHRMEPNPTPTTERPTSHTTQLYDRYVELSSGEQAELRRGTTAAPFWQLLRTIGKHNAHKDDLRNWLLLIQCIAIAGHSKKPSLGNALKQAGYSEARLKRLLEADDDLLPGILRRTARQLKSSGHTGDWNIIRRILFDYKGEGDDARLQLAQDYFTYTPDDETSDADTSN